MGRRNPRRRSTQISEVAGVTGTAFFTADGQARTFDETLNILRAGLVGLSDQERSSRLFELFGADAIRAAEILLGTTDPAFDAVRETMRRQGAAADIAAAQNAGLRGAMDALGSSIETQLILAYEKLSPVLGKVVLGFANLFNNLASGGGVFATIRTALAGVAAGIGALVGVKAIIEGFGFLRVAIGLLVSPLGLLVTAFGLAGGAIAVLMEKSPALREALGNIGDTLKTAFGGVVDFFKGIGSAIGDFFTSGAGAGIIGGIGDRLGAGLEKVNDVVGPLVDRIQPALKGFGETLKTTVYPAIVNFLGDAAYFIVGTVIPNLQKFYDFLSGTLVPYLVDNVVEAFHFVKDAITELDFGKLAKIGGVLAAGVAGFAVGGPIGGVAAAAAATGLIFSETLRETIVDGIGNLGELIGNALEGPLNAAKDDGDGNFFKNVFTVDNLLDVAGTGASTSSRRSASRSATSSPTPAWSPPSPRSSGWRSPLRPASSRV